MYVAEKLFDMPSEFTQIQRCFMGVKLTQQCTLCKF